MAIAKRARSGCGTTGTEECPYYAFVRYEGRLVREEEQFSDLVSRYLKSQACDWFGTLLGGAAGQPDRSLMTIYFRTLRPEAEWRELLLLGQSAECILEDIRFVTDEESSWELRLANEAEVVSSGGRRFGQACSFGPVAHLRARKVPLVL
jgi:hypothetical protein